MTASTNAVPPTSTSASIMAEPVRARLTRLARRAVPFALILLAAPQASSADLPPLIWGASMQDAIVAVGQRASINPRTCRERVAKAATDATRLCPELVIERHRLGDHAYRVVFDTSVGHLTEVRLTPSDPAHDAAAEAAFETIRQALAEATGHGPAVRPLDPWDAALLGADPKGRSRQATWGESERVTLALVIPADGTAKPHVSLRHDPFELKVVQPVLIRGADSSAIRNIEPLRKIGIVPLTKNTVSGILIKTVPEPGRQ